MVGSAVIVHPNQLLPVLPPPAPHNTHTPTTPHSTIIGIEIYLTNIIYLFQHVVMYHTL